MEFKIADIVRYKRQTGLFEVTGAYTDKAAYDYTITNNECDTERYVLGEHLIMVCPAELRKDI
ncbi:hypothetical protein A8F94_17335 [Bacillus sp. FJAT-27225]|uniref:hypothetical protein n=1 Tax=Bacillus sp. FJAT-27225 TaxID=1743144 RepID=UPI00080C2096|nr:hypothetical protein [Bacillus sp. FJAT-27225]OCA84461.1 hypothetical protein A8F94_17335 [Bacillus sp. FJAT-27225]